MKKVIIFGDLPIATKVAKYIKKLSTLELCGVVIGNTNFKNNDPWTDEPLFEYSNKENIKIFSQEEIIKNYQKGELYLGLSCRFSQIIKKEVINRFEYGILNLHGGLLPEFAGLYSVNHTFLCDNKVGGGSIHFVNEGIDTGDIVKRCEFKIEDEDTAYTVFQKTQKVLYENLKKILIKIDKNEKINTKKLDEYVAEGYPSRYFNKYSLEGKKEISIDKLDSKEALLKIKAFDFPGYEPAYIKINGKKIYLRTNI